MLCSILPVTIKNIKTYNHDASKIHQQARIRAV
jgi:hypothetical protein